MLVAFAFVVAASVVAAGLRHLAFGSVTQTDALPLRTIATVALPGAATRFDYESLDPKTGFLFLAHLAASEVVVFDVRANRVVATIPNLDRVHGVLAVPSRGRVYATATGSNEVAVIDERTLAVVARVPGGTYPDGMAYDPRNGKLYVSDERGDTDTVIDTATNARVATIPLGGDVGNTQYDSVSNRMFVNVQTRGVLVAIDPNRDAIVARYPVTNCASNHGLLIDERRRRAYVACEDNATLVVYDLRTMKQTQALAVGDDPDVLAYDPGIARLYVAAESGIVAIFDSAGGRMRTIGRSFLGTNAHIVAVDPRTHRAFFPILGERGPTMIVAAPLAKRTNR